MRAEPGRSFRGHARCSKRSVRHCQSLGRFFVYPSTGLAAVRGALRLLERTAFDRVDVKGGVIHGVKIVGLESRNIGRTIGLDPDEFAGALDKPYGYSPSA